MTFELHDCPVKVGSFGAIVLKKIFKTEFVHLFLWIPWGWKIPYTSSLVRMGYSFRPFACSCTSFGAILAFGLHFIFRSSTRSTFYECVELTWQKNSAKMIWECSNLSAPERKHQFQGEIANGPQTGLAPFHLHTSTARAISMAWWVSEKNILSDGIEYYESPIFYHLTKKQTMSMLSPLKYVNLIFFALPSVGSVF